MEGNYIRIYRSMLDWEWYRDINTKILFLHMLLKANWRDSRFQGTTVPRGSFISSHQKLAEETGLTMREIRTAITHLKTTGEVTCKATNKYSVFTVVNYDLYQTNDTQNDSREAVKRQSNDILTTTIEKEKKERREENKKEAPKGAKKKAQPVYYPDDEMLNQAFADYVAMRKKIKKPMSDRAVILAMSKLKSLSPGPGGDGVDHGKAVRILEQSVLYSWQGLFPLKEDENGHTGSNAGTYDKGFNGRLLEAGYEPEYKEFPFAD